MSNERLLALLAKLEECRTMALADGQRDVARLLAMAVLDVKMQLHGISDAELKALCDAMLANAGLARTRGRKLVAGGPRQPPLGLI